MLHINKLLTLPAKSGRKRFLFFCRVGRDANISRGIRGLCQILKHVGWKRQLADNRSPNYSTARQDNANIRGSHVRKIEMETQVEFTDQGLTYPCENRIWSPLEVQPPASHRRISSHKVHVAFVCVHAIPDPHCNKWIETEFRVAPFQNLL